MHADQRREVDQAPFVLHPLEVASLLSGREFDDEVVTAGVLHDIVEDTSVTRDDIERRFGTRVARLVAALTENPNIADYGQRKAALRDQVARADRDVHAIYAADKIAKVRELRARATQEPRVLHGRKLEYYRASLETLRGCVDGLTLVDRLEFELWALDVLPPSQPGNGQFTAA